jgi:hypothetical protein
MNNNIFGIKDTAKNTSLLLETIREKTNKHKERNQMNQITINGTTITTVGSCNNVTIRNGKIIVDGKTIDGISNTSEVKIIGNVAKLEVTGSVEVQGDVQGNIDCGGSVNCGNVGGSVDCGGSCNAGDVSGDIDAGGSVHCSRRK